MLAGVRYIQLLFLLVVTTAWYSDNAELPVLEIRSTQINSILLHPDGKSLLLSSGSQILVWDIYKKQILQRYHSAAHEVAIMSLSADGQWLAAGYNNGEVTIWNANTFEVLHQFAGHQSNLTTIDINAASGIVTTGDHLGHVKIWDLSTAQLKKELPAHKTPITVLDISLDGQTLLTASEENANAILWDLSQESKKQKLVGHLSQINAACFLNESIILTGSNDKTISAWNRQTGEITNTLLGHKGNVIAIKPLKGQAKFVSASSDGEMIVWNSTSLKELERFTIDKTEILQMELHDNMLVPLHKNKQISLWDLTEQKKTEVIHISNTPIRTGQTCNANNFILTGDENGLVKKHQLNNGDLVQLFQAHEKGINQIISSSDGKKFATASDDKTLKVWNSKTGELLHTLEGHKGSILSLAFSKDGNFLYSGGKDKLIKWWNLSSGTEISSFKAHGSDVTDLIALEDNRILSVGKDRKIKIHVAENGDVESEVGTNMLAISSAVYAPLDSLLYVGDIEGKISIFHTGQNLLMDRLNGHKSKINNLTLNNDASYLLSGSDDHSAILWHLPSRELEHTFEGHKAPVSYCSFGQDEATIITTSLDKQIKVWSTQELVQR